MGKATGSGSGNLELLKKIKEMETRIAELETGISKVNGLNVYNGAESLGINAETLTSFDDLIAKIPSGSIFYDQANASRYVGMCPSSVGTLEILRLAPTRIVILFYGKYSTTFRMQLNDDGKATNKWHRHDMTAVTAS